MKTTSTTAKAKLRRSEHDEQKSLIRWVSLAVNRWPELDLLYAIPNGGDRNYIVAAKLKAEGVRAGVPDLHLPVARGEYHSLYIELKTVNRKPTRGGKGGVSEHQARWISGLQAQNNRVEVCYGADEAIQIIENYLTITT